MSAAVDLDAIRARLAVATSGPYSADLILRAPQDIAALIAEVERLRLELDYDPDDPTWGTKNRSRGQLRRKLRGQHKAAKRAHEQIAALGAENRRLREMVETIHRWVILTRESYKGSSYTCATCGAGYSEQHRSDCPLAVFLASLPTDA